MLHRRYLGILLHWRCLLPASCCLSFLLNQRWQSKGQEGFQDRSPQRSHSRNQSCRRSFALGSRRNIIFPEDSKMYPEVTRGNARTRLLSPTGRQMPFLDPSPARQVWGGASQLGPLPGTGPQVPGRGEGPSACPARSHCNVCSGYLVFPFCGDLM